MFPRWPVLALFVFTSDACFAEDNDKQLLESLLAAPEIRLLSDEQMLADIDQKELVKKRLPRTARPDTSKTKSGNGKQLTQDIFLYQHNQQLHEALLAAAKREGLPVKIPGAALPFREAVVMQALSRELRASGFVSFSASERSPEETASAFEKWCADNHIEKFAGVPGTLVQMMQVEEEPIRLEMIGQLNKIGSSKASTLLAKRALFDSSAEVREAAVTALSKRAPKEYMPELRKGFRHPWPAVADHAAAALTKLKSPESVSELVQLLDKSDPRAPFRDPRTKKLMVPEMVRINHLRNCFLCHAASAGEGDGLLVTSPPGFVQKGKDKGDLKRTTNKETPATTSRNPYYGPPAKDAIRADMTFLRQDFSAMLKGKEGKPERFDFFIRTRPAKTEESSGLSGNEMDYPQRRAVLRALRKMTGKDGGDSPGRWRELLGIEKKDAGPNEKLLLKATTTESVQLAETLLKAIGPDRDKMLENMETEKGSKYTEALALAIPKLEGEAKSKTREALANRLTRMRDETLEEYFRDNDAEIRRAAAIAAGQKDSKELVPKLIGLLRDPEMSVVRAAHASLKELTGHDFGPAATATREEREQAVLKWIAWWNEKRKKF